MRKLFFVILILNGLLAYSQTSKTLVWDYPVKPGMNEWKQFESMDAMFQACQIPENTLKNLDTESLVRICYDFPSFMGMFFYNSPQAGFDYVYKQTKKYINE